MASLIMGGLVGTTCGLSSIIVARTLPQLGADLPRPCAVSPPHSATRSGRAAGRRTVDIYLRVTLGLKLAGGPFSWPIWCGPTHFLYSRFSIVTSRFDQRLTEVASDLGATPWRAFVDIELPLIFRGSCRPSCSAFSFSFSELARSVLLRGGKTTLPIYEWIEASAHSSSVPLIFALSTIELLCSTVVVVMAFSILFGRRP